MESDLQQIYPHQMEPIGSGLVRYQSAPSSFFSSFLDSDDFFPRRPLSPETERIIARFMNSGTDTAVPSDNLPPNSPPQHQIQPMGSVKMETVFHEHQNQPSNFYQSSSQPPRPTPVDYTAAGRNRLPPMKMEAGNSNLVRQRSSPAGLFANINIDNELASYAASRGMGNSGYGGSRNEPSFGIGSSMVPAPSGLQTIAENEAKPIGGVDSLQGVDESYATGFPMGSWDDSALMSTNVSGLKRVRDDEGTENRVQSRDGGSGRPPLLAHHLSLQKTSAEMAAIDNFFQFQDSVPCKIRAKRGCATHPRSIAERVRRTKISERMRKLQELVPNMDKQTNTSDMLDLAVDYIKELQKEVEKLSDSRSKCTCPHKQHS